MTVVRFLRADKWVTHNYDVRLALGDLQSAISAAARARTSFLDSGDDSNLASYSASKTEAHEKLVQVRDLTKDNPAQQALSNWLEDNALRRLELLDTSIELPKSGPLDEATQLRLSHENIDAATDVMDVTEKMDDEEERLLDQR